MKRYRVIGQSDKWFAGRFDLNGLEKLINSYAKQGWKLVSSFSASVPSLLNVQKDEAIFILEKDVDESSWNELNDENLKEETKNKIERLIKLNE